LSLADLIASVEESYQDFPPELVIDEIVDMSKQPRLKWEVSHLGRFLAYLGRRHGGRITKENLLRMVIPGDGWSRAGLTGLGALYDEHADHLRSMKLPEAFDEAGYPDVAFYCRLRQKYPGVKALHLALGNYDYSVGRLTVETSDRGRFHNAWANRGESAYMDYLGEVKRDPPNAES
jgi:hypothetical protein